MIKSGNSPIVDVIGPGERLRKRGLTFAATPASDFICGTLQAAAGMNLQVFTTGRGTPYNLPMTPVIKVSSNSTLGQRWHDLIDLDAGRIATGEASIEEMGWELFHLILEVASGRRQVAADRLGLYNDLVLFNPAPVTDSLSLVLSIMTRGNAMFPKITKMNIVPVAGEDGFLLNLSGGHAPWFIRCVLVLEDESGNRGVGEIPSSEGILKGLEKCRELVEGARVNEVKQVLSRARDLLAQGGPEERGRQTFDLRVAVHVITAIESALFDLFGQALGMPVADLLGQYGRQRDEVEALGYLFLLGDPDKTDLPYPRVAGPVDAWDEVRYREAMTPEAVANLAKAPTSAMASVISSSRAVCCAAKKKPIASARSTRPSLKPA